MRLGPVFSAAREENRAALITFLTAGDPSLADTVELTLAIHEAGADIVELGIPYSDPIADGSAIQAAGQRALRAGTTVGGVLETARQVTARGPVPLVLMTCYNPILQFGPQEFAWRAADAGVAAVLVSDLPPEEADDWVKLTQEAGLENIFLVAPTTLPDRALLACELSTGFVYVVSRPGTTGAREELPLGLPDFLHSLREYTSRPLAVGFGISTPEQVGQIAQLADGAIVGSALVQTIGARAPAGEHIPAAVEFVSSLAAATQRA